MQKFGTLIENFESFSLRAGGQYTRVITNQISIPGGGVITGNDMDHILFERGAMWFREGDGRNRDNPTSSFQQGLAQKKFVILLLKRKYQEFDSLKQRLTEHLGLWQRFPQSYSPPHQSSVDYLKDLANRIKNLQDALKKVNAYLNRFEEYRRTNAPRVENPLYNERLKMSLEHQIDSINP